MKSKVIITLVCLGLFFAATMSWAQTVSYDPNAEKYVLLSLNQAYVNLGIQAKNFIRAKEQFENKLISEVDYDHSLSAYRNAKINYDMALMRVLQNVSYVIVEKAVKKTTSDGTKIVDVTVKNEVGGSFEMSKINIFGARETKMAGGNWGKDEKSNQASLTREDFVDYETAILDSMPYLEGQGIDFDEVINLLEINNIFISLQGRSDDGSTVMISSPYERKIDKLGQNERATVRFELLRDVESCTIQIAFGDKSIAKPVYLKLESTAGGVEVASQIPSVQADMDSTASYNLSLQRFSAASTAFSLRIANLPEQIDYNFVDPDNNNQQVTIVNFTEGTVRKNLRLDLTMPTRASDKIQVEQAIPFQALVLNSTEVKKFDELSREYGRYIPEEELKTLSAGLVDLTVIPKGVGRVEVSASTFYYPIQPDETVNMTIVVKNTGTGELKNIKVTADLPNNEWDYTIEPDLIRSIQPEQEAKVALTFQPPAEATVGEHILKVKVEAKDRNRIIEADDKDVTVEIKAKPDIMGRLILIVLLIGIVLGIVIFGIKLSRR